ncbi:MAG: chemotaxis protein CheC, partial [Dysosmobacter welbionis]
KYNTVNGEYNDAIDWIGGPEVITAGVLVRLGGEINGIMLSVQQMDFINQVLGRMMNRTVCEYGQLSELDRSALVEVGNIMISTFVNALSGLAGVTIQPSVPGFAVDMQGRLLRCPWRSLRTVGLHYDHRHQFHLRKAQRALPPPAVT